MMRSRYLISLFFVTTMACLLSTTAYAKNDWHSQIGYTSIAVSQVEAPDEATFNLNPRTVPVDGKYGFTFMDGFQISQLFSVEIGVTHAGTSADIFSLFGQVRSPMYHHLSATAKYGVSVANNLGHAVYGAGFNYHIANDQAFGLEYSRQYSYVQQEALKEEGGPSKYPTDWLIDIQSMQPLNFLSLKYTNYLLKCNQECWQKRVPVYAKGDYMGLGLASLTRHLTYGGMRNNPENETANTSTHSPQPQSDTMLAYGLTHGNQITENFGMEFGVVGSAKENYLNFYSAAARFTLPVRAQIRPYAKSRHYLHQ